MRVNGASPPIRLRFSKPVQRRVLAIALALVALSFIVVSLRDTISWIGKPYPGFLLYPNGIISVYQPPGKEVKERLAYPGYITEADGRRSSLLR